MRNLLGFILSITLIALLMYFFIAFCLWDVGWMINVKGWVGIVVRFLFGVGMCAAVNGYIEEYR